MAAFTQTINTDGNSKLTTSIFDTNVNQWMMLVQNYAQNGSGIWVPVSPTNPMPSTVSSSSVAAGDVVSITTTNTAQQLPSVSSKTKITLIGMKRNTGTVYAGFANTVTNAVHYFAALDPKDSIDLEITNLNMVYIYGNAGDGVSYVAV